MALAPNLISPKERTLFAIGVLFSSLVWLGLILSLLGLLYGLLIAVVVLVGHALFLAHVRGNGLRLSERQFPELYGRFVAAAKELGLQEVPEIYVMESGGVLNAFATKLFSRRMVIVLSDLVDECKDPRQLDFVVGHELGHFAAGHLAWNAFLLPYRLLPWFGPAYSRACEYTCDRCGHAISGDLEQSKRALVVLAAGGTLAQRADLDEFIAQRNESGGFWMAVYELVSSHPYLCKRAAALQELGAPGTVRPVGRNPFAYPLAPVLGAGAGVGLSSAVWLVAAVIGITAAIAIPNFLRFQERARATATVQGSEQEAFEAALRALEAAAAEGDEETYGEEAEASAGPE
jgi:Zn-dependent protease with chaperone function